MAAGVPMYLFYIDESGNTGHDLSSTVEPVHWVVALGVTEHQAQAIETDLLGIALKYFRDRAHAADFEFHGAQIFSGRGDARALSPGQRISLYREILELIPRHGARLWIRGIAKSRHAARAATQRYHADHPYRLAFMFLVEALDEWLEHIQPAPPLLAEGHPTTLGLLVSDEQDEVSRDLIAGFARWRQFGTDFGYRARDIRHLIDTIHYVKSEDSWLIQLVDCAAFIRNRLHKMQVRHGANAAEWPREASVILGLWTACMGTVEGERVWPG